jgi:predicted ArsR family transcriptional regulator
MQCGRILPTWGGMALFANRESSTGFANPHSMYARTAEAEQLFPKAYGTLLDIVLTVLSKKLTKRELRAGMREAGRKIAAGYRSEVRGKNRKQNIETALTVLKELGGAASVYENESKYFIRGNSCPLAATTGRHPEACLIAESLLTEIISAPMKERCMHGQTPSCCFEILTYD